MSLPNGHKLTIYEILEPIGKGGMDGQELFYLAHGEEPFLMITEGGSDETSSTRFVLVQNWFQELERLVAERKLVEPGS